MKLKKWHIILGIILVSLSQTQDFVHEFMYSIIGNLSRTSVFGLFIGAIGMVIVGLFELINKFINFLFSWQGVLLIAVILTYTSYKKYINK